MIEFRNINGQWRDGNGLPIETFPMQVRDDTVPLVVAEEAYKEYAAQYGKSQSLQRIGERGGFGAAEIAILLYERCKRLRGNTLTYREMPT